MIIINYFTDPIREPNVEHISFMVGRVVVQVPVQMAKDHHIVEQQDTEVGNPVHRMVRLRISIALRVGIVGELRTEVAV